MPALTRKRVNDRPATWHIHYVGVRVGVIVAVLLALCVLGYIWSLQ